VRFVAEATQRVRPFSGLCAAYGISRPTGYLVAAALPRAGGGRDRGAAESQVFEKLMDGSA
jgi:hypothetical protein